MTTPSNPDPDPRFSPGIGAGGDVPAGRAPGTTPPRTTPPGTPPPGTTPAGETAAGTTPAGTAPPGTPPGETPPAEGSTGTGAGPYRRPTRGWASGPLVAIWLLVILCAVGFAAYAIALAVR